MSKRVLIISTSPRKGGNSDTLCDEFIRGAREAGHAVEKIYFHDKKINYCLGCNFYLSPHKCIHNDDMEEVLDKMVDADVLVFGTPVYYNTLSAQFKTLIDRIVSRHGELKGQAYLIASLGSGNKKDDAGIRVAFRGFIDTFDNVEVAGMIFGYGVQKRGTIAGNPALVEAYNAGKNI